MPELQLSDAINQDVSVPTETPLTAREIAMEKIASAQIERARATGDFDGMDDVDVDPDNPDADQLALQAPVAQPTPVAPTPKVHVVKIDGEERQVTDDELIRSYQKNSAADRRLEEASNLLREANERAAQVVAPTQVTTPEAPSPDLQAKVKTVLSRLYEGDEDNAAEALTNLLMENRGGGQPTPAPNIDIDQLTVQIQQKMDIDKAFESIKSDYPDLIADPDLEMLTAMKINRAIANGTPRAQAMLDSAAEVYKLAGKVAVGRQAETPKPGSVNRLENKQKLDLVRPASGVASQRATPNEEDASSVIAEMAARRLGQSIPRRVA